MLRNMIGPLTKDFIVKHGGKFRKYGRQRNVYLQGEPAGELFYIIGGKVLVTILSESGKEALIAILGPGHFFGEDCVDAEKLRSSTVLTATDCELAVFDSADVLDNIGSVPDFAKFFATFLMQRNKQLKTSLVDQMLLTSEKRLARLLLRLVEPGEDADADLINILDNQDMMARMVGTTRPRINTFMNKFRKLGYVDYNGQLRVYESLKSILAE